MRFTDGRLRVVTGETVNADLGHWHHDTFLATFDQRWNSEQLVTFALDSTGAISKMTFFGQSWERVAESE